MIQEADLMAPTTYLLALPVFRKNVSVCKETGKLLTCFIILESPAALMNAMISKKPGTI